MARYQDCGVPKWFELPVEAPQHQSKHENSIQALFHLTEHCDAKVLPSSFVLDPYEKSLDIDRSLRFVRVVYQSIEEARRRAYLIGVLTYDFHSGLFVRMASKEMLQDPFVV